MCPFIAVLLWTVVPTIGTSGEESEDSTHRRRSSPRQPENVQVGALKSVRQSRGNAARTPSGRDDLSAGSWNGCSAAAGGGSARSCSSNADFARATPET